MKKRIIHYIKEPFENISLCGVDVLGNFSSLDVHNINCEDCLKRLKQQG